ncbi:phosphoadenosine phosphosulfate reductase family protein (plasmid) [Streptomyces sp. NBC_01298]|uniref:phosphoadenosine phosphosulfate reductase family protein n=1 Tax=Streptomyces sp. NBC_01298 TaxID=2903817 RepID=UPI002E0F4CA7|nr:phosphoadenosine phosphosulfate reductase family protein [Streptomyces sp. NBC_01298]
MNATNVLRTVDMIRRATASVSGHRAAWRELHEARAAQTLFSYDAGEVCEAAQSSTLRSERRLQLAASKLHPWRPLLNRYPTEHHRRNATRNLLEHLADDDVALIKAADIVVIQTSAGKDSVVALHRVVAAARKAGCMHKLRVMHCDLGQAEWPGVRQLARRQAERYGIPFILVESEGGFLGMVEDRGLWPDSARRLCTAYLKRDPTGPVITKLVEGLGLDRQAIVLNVMGVRGAESRSRARKSRLTLDDRTSSSNRLVLTWNIIHELSESQVWREIADHVLEYHPIYDTGLQRLSCVYCVLAGPDWLVLATRICFALGLPHPDLYTALERQINHSFKQNLTLGGVVAAARMLDALDGPLTWSRGDALRRHLGPSAADAYLAKLAV